MKKNINKILEVIIPVLSGMILIVLCIDNKKYELLVGIIIVIAILAVLFLILYILILKDIINDRKIKKHYKTIEAINDKRIFDELFVLTYKKELNSFIKDLLNDSQKHEINSMNSVVVNTNRILIYHKYKDFNIGILVERNGIYYSINKPIRFNDLNTKDKLSLKKRVNANYNNLLDVKDLICEIFELIENVKAEINLYIQANSVDDIFNGRLLNNVEPYTQALKKEGIIGVSLGLPLMIGMSIGFGCAFIDENFRVNNVINFYSLIIICLLLFLFSTYGFIYGIYKLKKFNDFKKDFIFKRSNVLKDRPYKMKIFKYRIGKYSKTKYMKKAILYFDKIKLIIPISYKMIKNEMNIKKCYDECLKINSDIKYLTKSKIIIDTEKYRNIIDKFLTKI